MLKKLCAVMVAVLSVSMLAGCGDNATQELAKQVSESGKAANEAAASVAEGFSNIGEKANEFQEGVSNASEILPQDTEKSIVEESIIQEKLANSFEPSTTDNGSTTKDTSSVISCTIKAQEAIDFISSLDGSTSLYTFQQTNYYEDTDSITFEYKAKEIDATFVIEVEDATQKVLGLSVWSTDRVGFSLLTSRSLQLPDLGLDKDKLQAYTTDLTSGKEVHDNNYLLAMHFSAEDDDSMRYTLVVITE